MGERGSKALDLSAREMPFLVTRFAYLISASRLTVVRWPPEQYKNLTETLGNINIFKLGDSVRDSEWARPCHEGEPLINIIFRKYAHSESMRGAVSFRCACTPLFKNAYH